MRNGRQKVLFNSKLHFKTAQKVRNNKRIRHPNKHYVFKH